MLTASSDEADRIIGLELGADDYLTAVLTVMMLSLAGIPLTAGFIGKFYIVATGVEAHEWWLVASLVLGSAIGVFYYLRVMVTLYLIEPNLRRVDAELHWEQKAGGVMLLAFLILLPWSMMSAWKLTALRLGEDRAVSFGIDVRQRRAKPCCSAFR